ncbi:FAD/NAD(P)-binding domain-containing protein [Pseudovirgaria hyperparasitica]|uniref:FAD/NAD(P)-binding domain-containing protein n=1 Tax=Pseudovirgaria hyperparasitica TaxID=470096 RepID=A0A6A6WDG2_9PEZI|nr:FAD/NAD(P)-binding domain-containing protein [Pseudovirgaria hyperparasitica]KAF2760868.1 FAD/NAD(P)-binding domain-containing protein [Pseudovirgaria hyperparasitica]
MGDITPAATTTTTTTNAHPQPPPPPPPKKPLSIAIIGGGIAGLALAIGLQNHGHADTKIYEAAPAFGEIGAGIAFGPNAMRACSLIDGRILAGFKKGATCNVSPERYDTFLSYVYAQDSRSGDGRKAGELIVHARREGQGGCWTGAQARCGVHRRYALGVLVGLLPAGTAVFGKQLVGIEESGCDDDDDDDDGGGRMILRFADGSTASADAVVGCDGIKSRTREILHPGKIRAQFSGEYGYRALLPREEAVSILGADFALNGMLYCGYNIGMITYPVENHALVNAFAVCRGEWTSETNMAPCSKAQMLADFTTTDGDDDGVDKGGLDARLVKMLHAFPDSSRWGIFDVPHNEPYYRNRICILGDAAHAATPNLGAGAGMAIEDALVLSRLLGRIEHKSQIEDAFRAYDAVRRPRTQKVVWESRRAGLANEFLMEGVGDNFEELERELNERYQWIWDVDLEGMVDEALGLLERGWKGEGWSDV